MTSGSRLSKAVEDIIESFKLFHLWVMLGVNDVKARYRGSVLGPLWITASLAVSVGGIAVLYSGLLKIDLTIFAPHIAVTLTIWTLIQTSLTEATSAFQVGSNVIKQTALPKSGHIGRLIIRNLFIFLHNLSVIVIVFVIFGVNNFPTALMALPGLFVVVLNITWISLIIASISAKYRDMPQLISNGLVFITIMTPVYWMPNMLGPRAWIVAMNPFYYLLEIVRAPLLGHEMPLNTWSIAILMTIVGWGIALLIYAQMRGKIVHWI